MIQSKSMSLIAAASIALCFLGACSTKSPWQQNMEAGEAALRSGNYTEAEKSFTLARNEAEKSGSKDDHLAMSINALANTYLEEKNKYMEAEPLCLKALALQEKAVGPEHSSLQKYLNTLGKDYFLQYRDGYLDGYGSDVDAAKAKAEATYKRAIAIADKNKDAAPIDAAESLNGLANLYVRELKEEEARPLLKRAMELREKSLGAETPAVADTLYDLANLEFKLANRKDAKDKYKTAEDLYKRTLAIQEKTLGKGHPDVAKTLDGLGQICQLDNRFKEAESYYIRAIAINQKSVAVDPELDSDQHLVFLYDEIDRKALLKPFTVGDYKYVPDVYKDSPKGFKLLKGNKVVIERHLDKEYPYEYANISLVKPMANARLKQDVQLKERWGNNVKLTGNRLTRLPVINNLTGSTTPSIIIGTFSGGMNSCCTDYELISLSPDGAKTTKLPSLEGRNVYDFTFGDFHGDGKLYAKGQDMVWAYWNASMADSTLPEVVLKYTPQGWRLSLEDMKVESVSAEAVKNALDDCFKNRARFDKDYPPPENVVNIGGDVWTVMLNLIYAGHANDAWKFLDDWWPKDREFCSQTEDGNYLSKAAFIKSIKDNLRKSSYWKDLQELNQGQVI